MSLKKGIFEITKKQAERKNSAFIFASFKAQILLLTAFLFSVVFSYRRKRERLTRRENRRENVTRGNINQRNTAHGSIFRPFSAFSRLGGTLGRVERLKRNTSDFLRLHGSRLEISERITGSERLTESRPKAEHGRSDNRKRAERKPFCKHLGKQKNPQQFRNHSVGKLSGKSVALSYNGYYVNVVFCRQILLHFCMCYFCRWIFTTT